MARDEHYVMAVVPVFTTDATPDVSRWEMPANPDSLRSPIPRGIIKYDGTAAIPLKGAGDLTDFKLIITLPDGFAYLMKSAAIKMVSDDLTAQFNLFGSMTVNINKSAAAAVSYPFNAHGNTIFGSGTRAGTIFTPVVGTAKFILMSDDVLDFRLQDDHADETPAGDAFWHIELFQYDVDQVLKYEVNTPIPVISQASF